MASTVHDRPQGDQQESAPDEQSADASQEQQKQEDKQGQQVKSSHIITEHIDVGVPADDAFRQWTEYDKWSEIFKKESADKADDRPGRGSRSQPRIKVRAKIGPSERQWTAEVTSTERGHRIRWQSKGPLKAKGATAFHRLDDRLTRIMVEIEYQPSGFLEVIGNFFRMQRRRVRRDLRLFKNYVELEKALDEGHGDSKGNGDDGDEGKDD